MKKFLLLLLMVAAGVYVYLPYRAAVKLEDAFRAADKEALERLIDFPAVRQSLKDQVTAKLNDEGLQESTESAAVQSQAKTASGFLVGVVADKVIDSMVTPEAIAHYLKLEAAMNSGTSMALHDKTWHSPTEFSARATDHSRFIFRFRGLDGWRVVSVEPGGKLGRQAQIPR